MFIRHKMIGKRERFYLVENSRQDGRVKQKVLAYLGDCQTIDDAIHSLERLLEWQYKHIDKWAQKAQDIEADREEMLRKHATQQGIEFIPTPYPTAARGSFSGVYTYWECKKSIEKAKKKIEKIEAQIDKLNFYRSA